VHVAAADSGCCLTDLVRKPARPLQHRADIMGIRSHVVDVAARDSLCSTQRRPLGTGIAVASAPVPRPIAGALRRMTHVSNEAN
jgi:hypothetical protein